MSRRTVPVDTPVDVVITMGCNVQCPALPCQLREDWGLDDPTGQPDEAFVETIQKIEAKVQDLIKDYKTFLRFRKRLPKDTVY